MVDPPRKVITGETVKLTLPDSCPLRTVLYIHGMGRDLLPYPGRPGTLCSRCAATFAASSGAGIRS
jgi:hypothetical protein